MYSIAPGYFMVREAVEDTVLRVPSPVGDEGVTAVPVPKGTVVSSSSTSVSAHN